MVRPYYEDIFTKTSFAALGSKQRRMIKRLFDKTYDSNTKMYDIPMALLSTHRGAIAQSLGDYSQRLSVTNPVMFRYLNVSQRVVLEQDLLYTFYLLSAQYQLDTAEGRRQHLASLSQQLQACALYIRELRNASTPGLPKKPEELLQQAIDDAGKHAAYLGLTSIAPLITDTIMATITEETKQSALWKEKVEVATKEWQGAGITHTVRGVMCDVNGRRLYWVWGSSLLSLILSILPEELSNKSQIRAGISAPSPITGYMSWVLYYARLGLNLGLLLKHTIAGPWMSEKERELPAWERFKTQWAFRKFSLLNDSIWATANMACFFWLIGSGLLGYLGNVATVGLLLMDASLTAWRFYEDSTQYNLDLQRYERDIVLVQQKLSEKKRKIQDDDVLLASLEQDTHRFRQMKAQQEQAKEDRDKLELELAQLRQAKARHESDWTYKKYNLINDLTYAVSLMAGFSLMCCFLFPPAALAPAAVALCGLLGAVLCFTLTMAYPAVSGGLDIAKSRETERSKHQDAQSLLAKFQVETDPNIKIQYYLDMKRLLAESAYQKRVITFQKMTLVSSMIFNAILPAIIFGGLMFAPLGIGIAVLVVGLLLPIIANKILKRYEPKPASLPGLDMDEYRRFQALDNPTLDDLSKPVTLQSKKDLLGGFFTPSSPSLRPSSPETASSCTPDDDRLSPEGNPA